MAATHFSGPVISDNGFEGPVTVTQVTLQSDNANSITLDAPSGLAASWTMLFPADDGTNGQVLTTDGNGVTSWTTNGAGTVTSVGGTGTVNGLTLTGTVTSSGNLTLGGTLALTSPPAIGGVAPNTAVFTEVTVNDKLIGGVQNLSGAGAVNLTDPITEVTTTGADALTLANGTAGQVKIVVMVVDGGDGTLTPTTPLGYSSITFSAIGNSVTLVYTSAGWAVVGVNGATVNP